MALLPVVFLQAILGTENDRERQLGQAQSWPQTWRAGEPERHPERQLGCACRDPLEKTIYFLRRQDHRDFGGKHRLHRKARRNGHYLRCRIGEVFQRIKFGEHEGQTSEMKENEEDV